MSRDRRDSVAIAVVAPDAVGVEAALRELRRRAEPVLAEWRRHELYLPPSARRRQKQFRARKRERKRARHAEQRATAYLARRARYRQRPTAWPTEAP